MLLNKNELYWHLKSIERWRVMAARHPFIWDGSFIEELAEQVRTDGLVCPFDWKVVSGSELNGRQSVTPEKTHSGGLTGFVRKLVENARSHGFLSPVDQEEIPRRELRAEGNMYREGFTYRGLNSRLRAVIFELNRAVSAIPIHEARIYAPEAVTPFAMLLRSRYPKFIGSEYTEDPAVLKTMFPLLCESLLGLSFPDGKFHAVVINEVFEHVPDIDLCLRELARVTAPGGYLISTFPFNIGAEESVTKARLGASGIEYLVEPEYHANPMDPKGSLVFEIPGWDILERARAAGWSKVRIVYHQSLKYGIVSNEFSGIFVLVAVR
jgi:hypothetical protein